MQEALNNFQKTAQEVSSLQKIFPTLSESDLQIKAEINEVAGQIDYIDTIELALYNTNRNFITKLRKIFEIRNNSSHDRLTSLNELTFDQKNKM